MKSFQVFLLSLLSIIFLTACLKSRPATKDVELPTPQIPWIDTVEPIVINGDEFFGEACSVIQVSKSNTGVKTTKTIFKAPSRILTPCPKSTRGFNYLDYDGEYVILNVSRQTIGAGSHTGERYRSKDFINWEEYIGITWRNSEEYEAWRKVGSTSSKADSIKKVLPE